MGRRGRPSTADMLAPALEVLAGFKAELDNPELNERGKIRARARVEGAEAVLAAFRTSPASFEIHTSRKGLRAFSCSYSDLTESEMRTRVADLLPSFDVQVFRVTTVRDISEVNPKDRRVSPDGKRRVKVSPSVWLPAE